MRVAQEAEPWLRTPSAISLWTIGTGALGALASLILTKRAEKEGWSRFKTGNIVAGIVIASGFNIWLATKIMGER